MKRPLLLFCVLIRGFVLLLIFETGLHAQYTASLGMRTGGTSGISLKYFYNRLAAAELITGTFGNGVSMTGLMEKYEPIYSARGLYAYYGAGTHVALYNGDNRYEHYNTYMGREVAYRRKNEIGFAVNAVFGIEYRMPGPIPLAFTVDIKPFVEMGSSGHLSVAPDPSIGIKVVFR